MRKTIISIAAALLVCSPAAFAEPTGAESLVLPFVRMDADPVTAGMGGIKILPSEANFVGASFLLGPAANTLDVRAGLALGKKLSVKVEYLSNMGKEFDVVDATNTADGKYKPSESVFALSAAFKVTEALSVEAGLNSCTSKPYDQVSLSGTVFDVHVRYAQGPLALAVGASSLGSEVKYKESAYPVPTSFDAAGSYRLTLGEGMALTVAAEVNYYTACGIRAGAGAAFDIAGLRASVGYSFGGVVPAGPRAGLSYTLGKIRIAACWLGGSRLGFGATFLF